MKTDITAELDAMRAARIESRIEEGLPVRKSSQVWFEEYKKSRASRKWKKLMPQIAPIEEATPAIEAAESAPLESEEPTHPTTPPPDAPPPPPVDVNMPAGDPPPSGPQPPVGEKPPQVQLELAAAMCGWYIHRGELYERTKGAEGTPMPPRQVIEGMVYPSLKRLETRAAEWLGLSQVDSLYIDLFVGCGPGAWVVLHGGYKLIEQKRKERAQQAPPPRRQPEAPPTNGKQSEPTPAPTQTTTATDIAVRRLNPAVLE